MGDAKKAAYMRAYRQKYRQTESGKEKIKAARRRWKKSENGKKAAREQAKRKYVYHPLPRVVRTIDERRQRDRNYYRAFVAEKTKRIRAKTLSHLKRYGLSKEDYLAMLQAQGNVCAICGGASGSSRNRRILCVDHDHATGKVRGLLCDNCNKGLGCLKDSIGLIWKALFYLRGGSR